MSLQLRSFTLTKYLPYNLNFSNKWTLSLQCYQVTHLGVRMTKRLKNMCNESLESNIVGLNRFYDFGEAKTTGGRIPWPAALLLNITIF